MMKTHSGQLARVSILVAFIPHGVGSRVRTIIKADPGN